jgi:hypothetical protein
VIALDLPGVTTWWRRSAAGLAVGSALLHAVSLPEHAHSPAALALLAAMIIGCLYCARHLWSRGALGDWALVAAMNLGMIGLHVSMLGGGAPHTGHSHGGHTMATAAPAPAMSMSMSPLMSAALALAAVEAAFAIAVVLFRTRGASHP